MEHVVAQHLREHFCYIGQQENFKCVHDKDLTLLVSLKTDFPAHYIVGISPSQDQEARAHLIEKALNLKAIPLTWFSYPMDQSLDTELTSKGFKHLAPVTGISFDLRQRILSPSLPSSLKMSAIKSIADFKKFFSIFEKTWDYPEGYGEFFLGDLLMSERFTFFLAYKDKEPVGISVLDIQGKIAGCYWDCVLPAYRQQGIGRFMVHQRLQMAQENGCTTVVAQCLHSSLNLYLNLGFQKSCKMALFRYAGM